MAILRLFLVFVGAPAYEYGVTTPNAQPPAEQLREQHGGILDCPDEEST